MENFLIQQQIELLEALLTALQQSQNIDEKLEILNQVPIVQKFLSEKKLLRMFLDGLGPECHIVVKSIIAIGQGSVVFQGMEDLENKFELLRDMLGLLLEVEMTYYSIGGIVGYHVKFLKLLVHNQLENKSPTKFRLIKPEEIDISSDENKAVRRAIRAGIEHLGDIAEIYPVGGAGDRLHLVDEKSGEFLPVGGLKFCGRTLLEGLIRDLQAREFLHYKLIARQLTTPIVMMTSLDKNNHEHILKICQEKQWFGRPSESFRLFAQPLVPVINCRGEWSLSAPLKLCLKPGGHGVIWKLAFDYGIFDWLFAQNRYKALLRQINNPIASIDYGILAFCGEGCLDRKQFGFASCNRLLHTAEGMVVLIETEESGKFEYRITNIEYTEFEKLGIRESPNKPGSSFSIYPSNTNILFADLNAIKAAIATCPIPRIIINLKNTSPCLDVDGKVIQIESGRLESMMQNIADAIVDEAPRPLDLSEYRSLKTFVTYSERRKTISVTKKSYSPGKSFLETPEGCFYDLLYNARELLVSRCGMVLPELNAEEGYLQNGPSFVVLYHPALGPLYSIIAQKVRRGVLKEGAELILEIAELELENLFLDGSLVLTAESISEAKCILKNVTVINRGIDRNVCNPYWKCEYKRHEVLEIVIEGTGEFFAENVTFYGSQNIIVPDKHRVTAFQNKNQVVLEVQRIDASSWYWKYTFDQDDRIVLSKAYS